MYETDHSFIFAFISTKVVKLAELFKRFKKGESLIVKFLWWKQR